VPTRAAALAAAVLLSACAARSPARPPAAAAAAQDAASPPPLLELRDLLVFEGGAPAIAPRVAALSGARVRVRGWLVVFEEPPEDVFWLAPRPVLQDESGAGSGDLPPRSIRVRAPAEVLRALPQDSAPLEATGRLEVGREVDADGRPSLVRLVVEDPRSVLHLAAPR
jgi:hypothetical protein